MYMAHSPCFFPCLPFAPLSTPLLLTWNPPSCDRIRPPRSQVACKLTSLAPTLPQTLPPPNSQNPNYPAPHYCKTTSGTIRRLLSGTISTVIMIQQWKFFKIFLFIMEPTLRWKLILCYSFSKLNWKLAPPPPPPPPPHKKCLSLLFIHAAFNQWKSHFPVLLKKQIRFYLFMD